MNKQGILAQIIEVLERESENLANAARTARSDATGEESKAENKYDTRGLEASYLAGAQAAMAAESKQNLACYKNIELHTFAEDAKIALTAFIELESEDGARSFYFLGPKSGGIEMQYNGKKVLLITPTSPLGRQLIGREVGDYISLQKKYEIIAVS